MKYFAQTYVRKSSTMIRTKKCIKEKYPPARVTPPYRLFFTDKIIAKPALSLA